MLLTLHSWPELLSQPGPAEVYFKIPVIIIRFMIQFNRLQLKLFIHLLEHLTYGLQTLDHPMEDVGLDCTLGPVLL